MSNAYSKANSTYSIPTIHVLLSLSLPLLSGTPFSLEEPLLVARELSWHRGIATWMGYLGPPKLCQGRTPMPVLTFIFTIELGVQLARHLQIS